MEVSDLARYATTEELAVIANVVQRANDRPAVLVTVKHGGFRRRYVVDRADEEQLRDYVGKSETELAELSRGMRGMLGFGCQWLRRYGRVDEMHRSLSLHEVVKVEQANRAKVWGQ
jgi:hypothetical protein